MKSDLSFVWFRSSLLRNGRETSGFSGATADFLLFGSKKSAVAPKKILAANEAVSKGKNIQKFFEKTGQKRIL